MGSIAPHTTRLSTRLAALAALAVVTATATADEATDILAARCVRCHGGAKAKNGLRLDSRAAAIRGGDTGPAVVPGIPEESLLVEAIHYEGLEMPPTESWRPRRLTSSPLGH